MTETKQETTPIEALQALMNGWAAYETEASEAQRKRIQEQDKNKKAADRRIIGDGFAEGSTAHQYAVMLKLPIVELLQGCPGAETLDLFAEQEEIIPRYRIEHEYWETMPYALGGEEPDDPYQDTDEEYGGAVGWDEDIVLFCCPRGVCGIPRADWQGGQRVCRAC